MKNEKWKMKNMKYDVFWNSFKKEKGLDVQKDIGFVMGHSLGEYSALVAADSIQFEDAIKLVVRFFFFFFCL